MAEENDKVNKTKEEETPKKKTEAPKKKPIKTKEIEETKEKKPIKTEEKEEAKDKKEIKTPPTPKKTPVKKVKKEAPKPKPKKVEKKEEKPTDIEKEEKEPSEEETEEEEEEEEEEIEIVEEEEEKEYKVKIKPKLSKELKHDLRVRKNIKDKTPHFRQQEWYRYGRINESWRRPRGMHSKMRKHKGYRPNVVSIGYGSPKKARNLHPSGFQEIMVYNTKDLEKINPKSQAARVGHSVGTRKRIEIEAQAEKKGIRILNPRRL
jgi:large subunit ribosomal protein L32e